MNGLYVTSSDSDGFGSLISNVDAKIRLSRLVTSSVYAIDVLGFFNTFFDTNIFSVLFVFSFDVFAICFSSSLKHVWLMSGLFSNNIWLTCLKVIMFKIEIILFFFSYFSTENDLFLPSCFLSKSSREFSRFIPTL